MEIILAGTASRNNIPAFRCVCAVCAKARASRDRKLRRKNSCAFIIGKKKERITIDAPPQFINQLEQCGISDTEIENILLTNGYGEHILGLFYAFSLKKSKERIINSPLNVYLGQDTLKSVTSIFKAPADGQVGDELNDIIKLNIIEEQREFRIGSIAVYALKTNHGSKQKRDFFGYCLNESGKNFYYFAVASKRIPDATVSFMRRKKPACIVIDCSFEKTDEMSGHGDIEGAITLRNMFHDSRIIVSHIDHSNLASLELSKIFDNEGIEIGHDGLRIQM
ncbi:MAG: MBL fold metallo-hydrolase [Spirochaetes bacterium]|nr:MBL fold metallo-hydrolase [Spirochaetota bacterium]